MFLAKLKTFFIATIIVAGTKIDNKEARIAPDTGIEPSIAEPKKLAIMRTTPDIIKEETSELDILKRPTSIPKHTRVTESILLVKLITPVPTRTPNTKASKTPIKKAQLPIRLVNNFFAIFVPPFINIC